MSAAVGPMNLAELLDAYREKFYRQSWYVGEAFMRVLPSEPPIANVVVVRRGVVPKPGESLPRAVDLAHLYLRTPDDPIWQDYVWCADLDFQGQRIYVGGLANGKGWEIHRHLHISDRFIVARAA